MVSEHFISEGKVEKAPGMLRCQDREARKLTETSVMLRRGKWKQAPVGGVALGRRENVWPTQNPPASQQTAPNTNFQALCTLGPGPNCLCSSPCLLKAFWSSRPRTKVTFSLKSSHFLSEIFLERLPPPSSGTAVLNSISLVLSSLKAITHTFSYIPRYPKEPLSPLKLYHTLFVTRM